LRKFVLIFLWKNFFRDKPQPEGEPFFAPSRLREIADED
jgi:hypothetical protein